MREQRIENQARLALRTWRWTPPTLRDHPEADTSCGLISGLEEVSARRDARLGRIELRGGSECVAGVLGWSVVSEQSIYAPHLVPLPKDHATTRITYHSLSFTIPECSPKASSCRIPVTTLSERSTDSRGYWDEPWVSKYGESRGSELVVLACVSRD